jgi:CRP-like cAMP-binding protein
MTVSCDKCPLRQKALFVPFTPEEITFMMGFKTGEVTVEAGSTILVEGSSSPQLYTVFSGMGTRSTTLENGRRQVISFVFPGDFIGMQGRLMGEMKHSVEASTSMVLCTFRRTDLWKLFQTRPDRAYDLTWMAAVDEHFLGETIATLGQRDAVQRISWALLRIENRLRAVGLGGSDKTSSFVPLPFRQQDLADALGLSLVHTNKTLARLRLARLADWSDGVLHVMDRKGLAEMALVAPERQEQRPIL